MKPSTTSSSPQRESAASGAPPLNHRHPFLQSRRQPHVHGAASESALDVTAAEKREHHHHHHNDVENATAPTPPASVAVAPAPAGDPAHPSNDGESREDDDDEVRRSFWVAQGGRERGRKRCLMMPPLFELGAKKAMSDDASSLSQPSSAHPSRPALSLSLPLSHPPTKNKNKKQNAARPLLAPRPLAPRRGPGGQRRPRLDRLADAGSRRWHREPEGAGARRRRGPCCGGSVDGRRRIHFRVFAEGLRGGKG